MSWRASRATVGLGLPEPSFLLMYLIYLIYLDFDVNADSLILLLISARAIDVGVDSHLSSPKSVFVESAWLTFNDGKLQPWK